MEKSAKQQLTQPSSEKNSIGQYLKSELANKRPSNSSHSIPKNRKRIARSIFFGKASREWFSLFIQLVGAIAIPVVLFKASSSFNVQQDKNNQAQHAADSQIANDQQQEATLKAYLDDMTNLLITYKLRDSQPQNVVRDVAQAKTVAVLRGSRLNPERKSILLSFLSSARLLSGKNVIISLNGTTLSGIVVLNANLASAQLNSANLTGAQLNSANLTGAQLDLANLTGAQLDLANLTDARLEFADLTNAQLVGADLSGADLKDATVTEEQLAQTKSLKGTIMPDGSTHP